MGLDKIFAAILCFGAFLFFTISNYQIIFRAKIKHEHTPSLTPFLGGISGALGVLAAVGTGYPLLIVLPLLADPGSIPLVIEFIYLLIFGTKSKAARVCSALKEKISEEDHGGIYIDGDSVIVMSVNDEEVKKYTDEFKKDLPQITLIHCRYSAKELAGVYDHLVKNVKHYNITGLSTDVINNRINVHTVKNNSELEKYLDSLENSDMICIEYTAAEHSDK